MLAIACAMVAPPLAHAQSNDPPPPLPAEYSDAARKAFAAEMKDARALMAQKHYEEAIGKLDLIAKDRPREPQARFLKGVALTELGNDEAAVGQFAALTADFPELPEPHNNLAALYARKGQYDLARRELELAIAADPDYAIASENLGDVYMRLAAVQYERVGTLQKSNKTAPLKLKLVRDALAVKSNTPPPANAGSTIVTKEKSK